MKKITFRVSSIISGIIAGAIGLLGFTACDDENGGDGGRLMYGTPTGTYKIKGAVTDTDGLPVVNADVILRQIYPGFVYTQNGDTVPTDKEGRYTINTHGDTKTIRIVCQPTDKDLEADSTEVIVKFDGKGDSMWDVGTAQETINFKLKPAKPQSDNN